MFLYKSLNINILKRRLYFPQNTYVFLEKVVHVFRKTRTCFWKKSYMFFGKHVRVFGKSRTCFSENTYMFLLNHTTENKSVYGNIQ